jgi:hypothetical protein
VSHLQDKVHSLETALDDTCLERDTLLAEVNQAARGGGPPGDSTADGQLDALKTALVGSCHGLSRGLNLYRVDACGLYTLTCV